MKNKSRPLSGMKTVGNAIIGKKKEKERDLLLMNGNQNTPGNGLWCVNLGNKNEDRYSSQLNTHTTNMMTGIISPNLEVDLEIERKMISQLRYQVQDLNAKLHSALNKCAEAEYKANRAENTKQNYEEMIEQREIQVKECEEKVDTYENTIINLNEALSNAKKEIMRLQSENSNLNEKKEKYYAMYQNLVLDKERKESSMSQEITNLMLKLQMTNNEKENLIRSVRNHSQQSNETTSYQKLLDDKESTIRLNDTQLNKLINENADLKRKMGVEEVFKSKLNEIIKKKKEKLTGIKEELRSYKEAMGQYNNDVKWNQELVLQRDNQIKVFKEKIRKLEEEVKKKDQIKNKNKKEIYTQDEIPEDDVSQVKARPFLFGPEKDEF
jgi:chromosome segregation ATPase